MSLLAAVRLGLNSHSAVCQRELTPLPAPREHLRPPFHADIHHTIGGLTFGKEGSYPIPGLSLHIPKLGNAGVQVAFELEGSAREAEIKVGLDACGSIDGHKICGSKVIHELPLWLISGKFSFGHICSAYEADMLAMAEAAASAPMPFAPVITDMSPSSLDGFAPLVVEGLEE